MVRGGYIKNGIIATKRGIRGWSLKVDTGERREGGGGPRWWTTNL